MTTSESTILIVEDIPNILDYLTVTLRFRGYNVITAKNGEEALQAAAQQKPSLVITDILMPKMDGFTLAQTLRSNPETQDVPIIFLSATYTSAADRDFALNLGADHFLEKPVDSENLLLTIGEILTSGSIPKHAPLNDTSFFEGYRERLQNKLVHKNNQIARTERLLESLPEDQKAAFKSLLAESLRERDLIQEELNQVQKKLGRSQ